MLMKDTGMCTSCGGCRLGLTCWQNIGLKESTQYIQHHLARFCLWCVVCSKYNMWRSRYRHVCKFWDRRISRAWLESMFIKFDLVTYTRADRILTAIFNPLNPELNPICYLLALLRGHHFLHVSRIRVKSLTFRRLMSYIYGAPTLDVSRSHTTTQHSR